MFPSLKYIIAGFKSLTFFPAPSLRKKVTDAQALAGDWQKVGDDIRSSMRKHGSPP